ncbi:MAG TPA: hypothetical protein VN832_05595 [Stellaceae bacterium]|nr:hypothetical protein [Stellaceae bacterium]
MADEIKPEPSERRKPAPAARRERLAAALRANLARRKQQARRRSRAEPTENR